MSSTSTSSDSRALRTSLQSSRLVEFTVAARKPSLEAARIWSRINESSGLMIRVGPWPSSRQHACGEPVDHALAPAGPLHQQHTRPFSQYSLDRLTLPISKLGVRAKELLQQRVQVSGRLVSRSQIWQRASSFIGLV